jgi:hypothetical protein
MMTGNAYIYFGYFKIGIGRVAVVESGTDCFDRFIYIENLAVFHAVGRGAPETQNLQLAELVLAPGNDGDFSGSDVKPHNYWLLVVHVSMLFLVVLNCGVSDHIG